MTRPAAKHHAANKRRRHRRVQHKKVKKAAALVSTTTTTTPQLPQKPLAAAPVASTAPVDANQLRPLIIAALCLSFALFGLASVPARVVPWRRAAYFLNERHIDFTLFGVVLLAAAAFAILLTKA